MLNSNAGTIDNVWENNTHNESDLINVDLPPAFGPVIIAFNGLNPPNTILFFILFSLFSRTGNHISFTLTIGLASSTT